MNKFFLVVNTLYAITQLILLFYIVLNVHLYNIMKAKIRHTFSEFGAFFNYELISSKTILVSN